MSKTVLITGAAKRVGRSIALDMASRGHRILIHYNRSADEAEQTVKDLRDAGAADADLVQADLCAIEDYKGLAEKVAAFGKLDCLVATAAVFRKTPWSECDENAWDYHMDANGKAVYLLCRSMTPYMNDDSSICLFADWSAQRPYKDYTPYCVSKAAVIALTKALALELAPTVRVNCICPGTILPPEDAPPEKIEKIKESTPLKKIGSPDDIAAAVRFLCEDNSFTTGTILTVDGGRLVANSDLY